jgi:uncharacterized protein DUF5753
MRGRRRSRGVPRPAVGLLQTAEYARRLLELVDPTGQRDIPAGHDLRPSAIGHALRRTPPDKAALRWPAGDRAVMAAQYDRTVSVSTLTNVKLGIIPLGQPVSAIPWCDVNVYDELGDDETSVVDVELPHGEVWVTEPDESRCTSISCASCGSRR